MWSICLDGVAAKPRSARGKTIVSMSKNLKKLHVILYKKYDSICLESALMWVNLSTWGSCPHHGLPGGQDYFLLFFLSGDHGITWLTPLKKTLWPNHVHLMIKCSSRHPITHLSCRYGIHELLFLLVCHNFTYTVKFKPVTPKELLAWLCAPTGPWPHPGVCSSALLSVVFCSRGPSFVVSARTMWSAAAGSSPQSKTPSCWLGHIRCQPVICRARGAGGISPVGYHQKHNEIRLTLVQAAQHREREPAEQRDGCQQRGKYKKTNKQKRGRFVVHITSQNV